MPRGKSFQDYLEKMDDSWKNARERAPGEFPDGQYLMRLEDCSGDFSAASGRAQVRFDWKITDGDYAGENYRDYVGVETEEQLFILQRRLARLGMEVPESAAALEDVLEELRAAKPLIRGRLRTRTTDTGEFQNLFIDRVLDAGEAEPARKAKPVPRLLEEPEPEPEAEAEPEPEPEAELEEEGETIELEVGARVLATIHGDEVEGEVLELSEETGIARVEVFETGKRWKIPVGQLTAIVVPEGEGEPEPEPEPEPRRPSGKVSRTTPRPRKKPGR